MRKKKGEARNDSRTKFEWRSGLDEGKQYTLRRNNMFPRSIPSISRGIYRALCGCTIYRHRLSLMTASQIISLHDLILSSFDRHPHLSHLRQADAIFFGPSRKDSKILTAMCAARPWLARRPCSRAQGQTVNILHGTSGHGQH